MKPETMRALFGGPEIPIDTVTITLPRESVRALFRLLSTMIRLQTQRIRSAEAEGVPPGPIANLQGLLQEMARRRAEMAPYLDPSETKTN